MNIKFCLFLIIPLVATLVLADSYSNSSIYSNGNIKDKGSDIIPGANYSINVNNTEHFDGYSVAGFITYLEGFYCKLTGCEMGGNTINNVTIGNATIPDANLSGSYGYSLQDAYDSGNIIQTGTIYLTEGATDYGFINVIKPRMNFNYNETKINFNITSDEDSTDCWYDFNSGTIGSLTKIDNTHFQKTELTRPNLEEGINNVTFYCNSSMGIYSTIPIYFYRNITYDFGNQLVFLNATNGQICDSNGCIPNASINANLQEAYNNNGTVTITNGSNSYIINVNDATTESGCDQASFQLQDNGTTVLSISRYSPYGCALVGMPIPALVTKTWLPEVDNSYDIGGVFLTDVGYTYRRFKDLYLAGTIKGQNSSGTQTLSMSLTGIQSQSFSVSESNETIQTASINLSGNAEFKNITLNNSLIDANTGLSYTLAELNTTGGSSGNPFNQELNTTENVTFVEIASNWFRGAYDWIIGTSSANWLSFNGTDLEFNETHLNESIPIIMDNNTISRIGNCPSGEVVMNTTTGGVQCIEPPAYNSSYMTNTYNVTYHGASADVTANRTAFLSTYNASYLTSISANSTTLDWTNVTGKPTSCSAGSYATALPTTSGTALTCSVPPVYNASYMTNTYNASYLTTSYNATYLAKANYQFLANNFNGSGNFSTTGRVNASLYYGNGSQLTSLPIYNSSYVGVVYSGSNVRTSALPFTNLFNLSTGYYRINFELNILRGATTSSILGGTTGVNFTYRSNNDGNYHTISPLLSSEMGVAIVPTTGNTGNTAGVTYSQGSIFINAIPSVGGNYNNVSIGYTSVGATTMQYSYAIVVEKLT